MACDYFKECSRMILDAANVSFEVHVTWKSKKLLRRQVKVPFQQQVLTLEQIHHHGIERMPLRKEVNIRRGANLLTI